MVRTFWRMLGKNCGLIESFGIYRLTPLNYQCTGMGPRPRPIEGLGPIPVHLLCLILYKLYTESINFIFAIFIRITLSALL